MNLWDLSFWLLGPAAFWFIGFGLYLVAYTQWRGEKRVTAAVERLTKVLEKDELHTATSELKADTFALSNLIVGLTKQLQRATDATEAWHESIKKICFWIPLSGGPKK